MIRNVICLFCLFFMLSCKSIDLYYPNYANCSGYKSLYVVDTIQIDDPVSVLTNSGYCFVMSKQAFDSFSGNEDSLFKRPDTFLLNEYLPMSVSIECFVSMYWQIHFLILIFLFQLNLIKKGLKILRFLLESRITFFWYWFEVITIMGLIRDLTVHLQLIWEIISSLSIRLQFLVI